MRATLNSLLRLLIAVGVFVGAAILAAFAWDAVGGEAARVYKVVFYAVGGGLLLFALLTRGAESRAGGMSSEITLERWFHVPGDERMRLNPTGVLVIAALVLLGLAVLVDLS